MLARVAWSCRRCGGGAAARTACRLPASLPDMKNIVFHLLSLLFLCAPCPFARRARLDAPTPAAWAAAALRQIGREPSFTPYWFHGLQQAVIRAAPTWLINRQVGAQHRLSAVVLVVDLCFAQVSSCTWSPGLPALARSAPAATACRARSYQCHLLLAPARPPDRCWPCTTTCVIATTAALRASRRRRLLLALKELAPREKSPPRASVSCASASDACAAEALIASCQRRIARLHARRS